MTDMHGNSPFIKGFFLKNPILVRAIGVGPVVGAAITLKHGISLSIIMAVLLFGSSLFGHFLGRMISERYRAPLNIILSAILLIPSYLVADWILPGGVISLSVFAPLMMVNSILASYVSNTSGGRIGEKLTDALGNSFGFAVVTLIVSAIREIIIYGTLFGHTVQNSFEIPAFKLPFVGFIFLGFAAALCKKLRFKYASRLIDKGGEYR